MPRTIIYVLWKLDVGGAEMRSLQLLRTLKREHPELRILVYLISGQKGQLDDVFVQAGMLLVAGRSGLRGLLHFWMTCLRERASVVHVNWGRFGGYTLFAALLAGSRTRIGHFRVAKEDSLGLVHRVQGWLGRALLLVCATDIVGVSAATRHAARIPPHRWRTIYNGVESEPSAIALAKRRVGREGTGRLIVMGRFHPVKNHGRALAVFEALTRRAGLKGFSLDIIGPATIEAASALSASASASPAGEVITVHKVTLRPLDWLRRADLLLLTSTSEGLPGVVLEALSVGTPVVASDIPGIREIAAAVNGVTLVPLDAADEAWTDAILATLRGARSETILSAFSQSPFRFEAHRDAITALWGLAPTPPPAGRGLAHPIEVEAAQEMGGLDFAKRPKCASAGLSNSVEQVSGAAASAIC